MHFTWTPRKSGSRYLVDGASQDCVDWYIRPSTSRIMTGSKTISAKTSWAFSTMNRKPTAIGAPKCMKVLAEREVDWKRALVAWKFKLAGEEQAAARYQYQDALAEAWGRTLYGGITRWCAANTASSPSAIGWNTATPI